MISLISNAVRSLSNEGGLKVNKLMCDALMVWLAGFGVVMFFLCR